MSSVVIYVPNPHSTRVSFFIGGPRLRFLSVRGAKVTGILPSITMVCVASPQWTRREYREITATGEGQSGVIEPSGACACISPILSTNPAPVSSF